MQEIGGQNGWDFEGYGDIGRAVASRVCHERAVRACDEAAFFPDRRIRSWIASTSRGNGGR